MVLVCLHLTLASRKWVVRESLRIRGAISSWLIKAASLSVASFVLKTWLLCSLPIVTPECCVHIHVLMSETQVLSAIALLLCLISTHPHLHYCSRVHWETGRWCHSCVNITMATFSSPCPPRHTAESPAHTHRPQDTNKVNSSPHCIRSKLNPWQPSLKSLVMVQVSLQ